MAMLPFAVVGRRHRPDVQHHRSAMIGLLPARYDRRPVHLSDGPASCMRGVGPDAQSGADGAVDGSRPWPKMPAAVLPIRKGPTIWVRLETDPVVSGRTELSARTVISTNSAVALLSIDRDPGQQGAADARERCGGST